MAGLCLYFVVMILFLAAILARAAAASEFAQRQEHTNLGNENLRVKGVGRELLSGQLLYPGVARSSSLTPSPFLLQ